MTEAAVHTWHGPTRDDEKFLKHTIVRWVGDHPVLDWKPVTMTKWQPQERTY